MIVSLLAVVGLVHGGEETHHYKDSEHVVLWMNTVGPYHNRQETYEYFSLPFCKARDKRILTEYFKLRYK